MKNRIRRNLGSVLIVFGVVLAVSAVALVLYNLYVDNKAAEGIDEIVRQISMDSEREVQPDYILNPNMEMPIATIDGVDYVGKISIPELELELPVISEFTYPNLKTAPCRYSGSVYLDNMVIAGHNYSSFFGTLKNISAGDTVVFTDIDGNVFNYEVVDMQVLLPTAVDNMITGDWDLSLFTCTVGGRTRFTVRCDRVNPY